MIEGFRSASEDIRTALDFAYKGLDEDTQAVLLKFCLENKRGKYFICLDRDDYTQYPDEKEILLQAGLTVEVKGCYDADRSGRRIENSDPIRQDKCTVFELYISDEMVQREERRRKRDYIMPIIWLAIHYLLYSHAYLLEI